ncbi:MAG: hypothetical protein LBK47_04880 [Prevotellaceae bacterium]|nr:hypothetical protein [Prevotellaceae bacterium]
MALMFPAAIAAFSAATMLLWSWLMPAIFGVSAINFWQALGLLVLARLLFGGFGGRRGWLGHHAMMHGRGRHGNPIREKWTKMTPEERKEFVKNHYRKHHEFFGGMPFEGHPFHQSEEPKKEE